VAALPGGAAGDRLARALTGRTQLDLAGLLVFAAAYLMATASPGPGVAAVVARTLARGPAGSGFFIAGFVLGDLVWFAVAASGLALLAETFAALFTAIRYAGAAFLLFLAWRFWTAPAVPAAADAPPPRPERGARLVLAGLAITLGNPKVIVFFLALLPTVLDLGALSRGGFAGIALLSAIILTGVLAAYTAAAARARRLLSSPRAVRAVNRGSGAAMAGAAVAVAAR
jgi:threonine/homoserine/homoserine lactone efflux protein